MILCNVYRNFIVSISMVDKLQTNPPQNPKKPDDEQRVTEKLDSQRLSVETHHQYLDQLHRQYNVEINHALLFYVENRQDPIIFADKDEIMIGRSDANGRITPEFDLGEFNGAVKGVSRLHAKIVWDSTNTRYLIQDLSSTNYTKLNGQKLLPYQYIPLPDGSILQFGHLAMNAFIITR